MTAQHCCRHANSCNRHRADHLIDALKRTASGLNEWINRDTLREMEKLDLLIPSLLGVPMEPPLLSGDSEKIKPAILGVLATLERYFDEANTAGY